MISKTAKWAITQILLLEIICDLESIFEKIEVDIMPIKGAYLIISGLGDRIHNRRITDIDIIVKSADLKLSTEYLTSLPQFKILTHYKDNSRPTESIFEYSLKNFKFRIEIMSIINSEDRFFLPSEMLFARGELKRKRTYYPSAEDALLIMVCHLQSHIPFEFRESNFAEIKILSESMNFSWSKFWHLAEDTGMASFIYFIIKLYCRKMNCKFEIPKRYFYPDLLLKHFTIEKYHNMSTYKRRLILDIPFVRKPITLMFGKLLG